MKSTLLMIFAYSVRTASKIVILVLVTRIGGFSAAGEYALALSVVTPTFLFFGLSLRQLFVTSKERVHYLQFLGMRLCLGVCGILVVCGVAALAFSDIAVFVIIMGVYRFVELLVDLNIAHFQRRSENAYMALVVLLFSVVTSGVLAVTFWITHQLTVSVLYASIAGLVVYFVTLLLGPVRSRSLGGSVMTSRKMLVSLRGGVMLSMSSFAVSLGTNTPVLLLGMFHSTESVGAYSAIYNLSAISNMLFSSVSDAELRKFVTWVDQEDWRRFRRRAWVVASWLCGIALLGAVVLLLMGTEVLSWVFSEDFSAQSLPLMVMAATICIAPFGFLTDVQLTALRRFSVQGTISIGTLALTVLLGFILIPDYGILGCTIVVFAVMSSRNIIKSVLVRRTVHKASFEPSRH